MEHVKLKTKDLKKAYNNGCQDVKKTLKELYPDVIFERELPKTWKEFCEMAEYKYRHFMDVPWFVAEYIEDVEEDGIYKRQYKGKETITPKYTALRKLELLRDYYNDGWKPDFKDISYKWCIYKIEDHIKITSYDSYNHFLSFKTSELADEFKTNFQDLIKQAEDLI